MCCFLAKGEAFLFSSVISFDHPSSFQKRQALARCHPFPAFVREESPLGRGNRHVSHFEDESGQRGISKPFVVVDSKLADLLVAGDKFPANCIPSMTIGRTCKRRMMTPFRRNWKLVTTALSSSNSLDQCGSVRSRNWRVTRKLRVLERSLP